MKLILRFIALKMSILRVDAAIIKRKKVKRNVYSNQNYRSRTGFAYSIRIQYEGYRGHFRSKARQPHYAPGHSKRTVKLTFHGPFDGLI